MTVDFFSILGREAQPVTPINGRLPAALEWTDIAAHSLLALSGHGKSLVLLGDAGFVIGTLFHRHGPAEPVHALELKDVEAITATNGQHLIDRFWGAYIAVIRKQDRLIVLRDPSGTLPCYYVASGEQLLLASNPSFFCIATGKTHDIDWPQLARALALGGLSEESTALATVRQLLPGMSLQIRKAEIASEMPWNPWTFACDPTHRSLEDGAEVLRRVTQCCVGGWGKLGRHVLLGVSGGLDSSIVAACLRASARDFACVTLKTDDPLGDERVYARALSSHIGQPLFEESYGLEDVDLDRSSVSHLPRPFGRPEARAYDAALVRVAKQINADSIFTGNGGDNVFYMSRSARPLADLISANGLSLGLLRTTRDISKLTGSNSANVIWHGLQAWRRAARGYAWKIEPRFLSDSVVRALTSRPVYHPWLEQPEGFSLPAKAAQIAMLIRMHHSLDAYREREGISVFHPLASQPLLEACLRIPSWQQCDQGVDRAVARRAFRCSLPDVVVNRRSKGGPQGFSFQVFHRFRSGIMERLLDGRLAHEGIIDRNSVHAAFSLDGRTSAMDVARLLMLVDAEAWVGHWRPR